MRIASATLNCELMAGPHGSSEGGAMHVKRQRIQIDAKGSMNRYITQWLTWTTTRTRKEQSGLSTSARDYTLAVQSVVTRISRRDTCIDDQTRYRQRVIQTTDNNDVAWRAHNNYVQYKR